ncbi:pentapeptide repeat-containing protein [Nocardia sp. NPDC052112]|uniref:pentapeptide repeat-containing protein n=1 Tax=Nocardia sp. NPDC052112 TaxID=3155646 RepID=UPI00342B0260
MFVGRTPLLAAVTLAVAGGMAIAGITGWIAALTLGIKDEPAAPLDITKLALVVAGGVGGAVALVVAYRRQRDLEQNRFIERFGAAAAQLGSPYTAVRIAGVYAMAIVTDESTGPRRQQCIDVLCGYLRLPYSPDTGANHQTGRDRKDTSTTDIAIEDHFQYLQNDKVVRQTIVRVIADHLRDHTHSWSNCNFNFTTAHLEDADFSDATFSGDIDFVGATFSDKTMFNNAKFSGDAKFVGTKFSGVVGFIGATFSGDARFDKAKFSDDAWFEAKFSGVARFDEAKFSGDARFNGVTFPSSARFDEATFSGKAKFDETTFSSKAKFNKATFSGEARFEGATFSRVAWFDEATFSGAVSSFRKADFGSRAVSFDHPRQWGPPPPEFDWDNDPSTKPTNVAPTPWPPVPAP